MHTMTFNIEPIAKGRPVFGKGFTYTPKRTRDAEKNLKILMRSQFKHKPLESSIKIEIVFFMKRPKICKRAYPSTRPDIDNLIKMVTDAGNEILWKDDNLIVQISARKEYGEPSIKLVVGEM